MKTAARALTIALGLLFTASAFAEAPTPAVKASAEAPAAKDAKVAKPAKPTKAEIPAAPGGGDGKVWVNHKSKIYHCEGAPDYGKTKDGEYMAEADAKTKGNKAKGGKACAVKAAKEVKETKETKETKAAK